MDEVRMVRDGYPEPAPPTAQVIARAKALLDAPPRRRPGPWLRWGLGGLVAAGMATAVAVALVGGNAPAPRPGTVRLDDRKAFLAAAAKAEQQPIGDYWYSDMVLGQSYVMRPKTGTYAITGALTEGFHWTGVRSGMGDAFYSRELPARPLTARDATLWRGAGSPSSFRVWSSDHYFTYTTTRATKWGLDSPDTRGGGRFAGRTAEELQNLPTDPAELAALFLNERALNERAAGLPPGRHLARAQKLRAMGPDAKIATVTGLLANAPLPPKVRAGLMRALATQPGVHSVGHHTDPLGRRGVALASDDRSVTVTGEYGAPKAVQGTYRYRMVAVFDEHTGAVLSHQEELTKPGGPYAEMKPGFVINYAAARAAKWSDTKPSPPAGLPFG